MATEFHLKWHNHKIDLVTVFEELLSKEVLVDVTLACEDFSLKAHKMVLSACSPFFQKLFLENPCKHPVIFLKDVPYADLKAIVDFIYKGETFVPEQRMEAVLKTARSLKVIGLSTVKDEHIGVANEARNVQISDQTENTHQQTSSNKKQEGRKSPHKSKATLIKHQSLPKTSTRIPDNEHSQTLEEPPQKRTMFKISSISASQCSSPVILTSSSHSIVNDEVVMLSKDDQAKNEIRKQQEVRPEKDKSSKVEATVCLDTPLNTANRKTGESPSLSSDAQSTSSLNLSEKSKVTIAQDEIQGKTLSTKCKEGELMRISMKASQHKKTDSHSKNVIEHEPTVMYEVINIDDSVFVCDVCGKTFPHRGFLQLHKRIHSGEKPWTCEVCSESFMQFSHLMQHQSDHKK